MANLFLTVHFMLPLPSVLNEARVSSGVHINVLLINYDPDVEGRETDRESGQEWELVLYGLESIHVNKQNTQIQNNRKSATIL